MRGRPIQVLTGAMCAAAAASAPVWAPASAAAASAGASGTSSAGAGTTSSSPGVLSDPVCQHALLPARRSVSSTAVMRPVAGSSKLAVKFRLLRRPAGASAFAPVHGPGLGTWLSKQAGSSPGDVWRVIHTVSDLSAPAAYRFSVSFRWTGSQGRVLSRATRLSRVCHQPELRPNLEVRRITVQTAGSDDVYRARIYDAGVTGVRRFQVELSYQGGSVTRRAGRLAAHHALTVRLPGPVCDSSDPPVVTVDPAHRLPVYSRAHASLTATCPSST